jgi:serine/threonine-protein kinase
VTAPKTVDDVTPIPGGGPSDGEGARSDTVPAAPDPAAIQADTGAPKPARTVLPAGTVIDGKYSILRLLGEGGMGVVYVARDIHTGIEVVLKSVRSELAHRADVRARTLAEGRALGQIDHPNVVQLKAVVVDDRSLWLVMQYIEGESLDRTIERCAAEKKRMPLAEALRFFRQIASGIAAAHAEGVIHRDLKPANVLVRKKDHVAKVTDFGIAKAEHDDTPGRVQTKGVIGSIWYMSPEQVTGRRDLDKRVDVYALGIVLFQMLTGHVPFDAKSDYEVMRQHAEEPLPSACAERPDLPRSVDALLQKLCAKKREDRFQSCEEAIAAVDALEAELAGKSPSAPPPAAAKSAPEPDGAEPARKPSKDNTAPPVASTRPPADRERVTEAPRPASRAGLWIGFAVLAAVAAASVLVAAGVLPAPWLAPPAGTADPGASPRPTATPPASTSASAPAPTATATPVAPFDRLPGTWVGSLDRTLEAVKVADTIEFRVKDPAQFAPADYAPGEARFVLRRIPGEESTFAVEDRLRPNPPQDYPFNRERARPTCQEVRSEAGGAPLRATFDGSRLSVELMKLEPSKANFLFEKNQTISCVGLGKLKASKVVSVLTRR